MADPLTAAELEHARWLAANRPDVTSHIVARLLDTLDEVQAVADGRLDVIRAFRSELAAVKRRRDAYPTMPRTRMEWRAWWRNVPDEGYRSAPPAVQAALPERTET